MRSKPNPEQRRRALCDAAIRLLADGGLKGVTHLRVDRKAGFPDGTASFYWRTSSALLRAVAERVAELDLKDLAAATRESTDAAGPSGLAILVSRSLRGARLLRTKARNELALQAARDSELSEALRRNTDEFMALIRDAVLRLQPGGHPPDPGQIDQQAYAVAMFIGGVMQDAASGGRRVHDAAELDFLISGIADGIRRRPPP